MSEIVTTAGRPMTGQLQRALDGMTASRREIVIRALTEGDLNGTLDPLYRALITELQLCGLREAEMNREFRQMMRDSVTDTRPWPQATGPAVRFDPETGEYLPMPDDSGEES